MLLLMTPSTSGYRVVSSCHTNKSCGMAILIKDSYSIFKIIKDDAGRFVQAINFGEDQLSFVSLYAPNKNPERNTFLLSLADLIDLSRPVFLAGHFNSVLDPLLDWKRRPSFVEGPSSRFQESGVGLQLLLQQTQTYPLWRELHPGELHVAHRLFVDAWVWYLCVPDRYDLGTCCYG